MGDAGHRYRATWGAVKQALRQRSSEAQPKMSHFNKVLAHLNDKNVDGIATYVF
jgi:hypothetical protein